MKISICSLGMGVLRGVLVLAGIFPLIACMPDDPEDPGFNKPALTGVTRGEIRTFDAYLDAVKQENTRRLREEGDTFSSPEGF